MQAAYERALSYAQERMVFGYPIGDYQLTQVKLARMATYLAVSRQFTYSVGRLMDKARATWKPAWSSSSPARPPNG
jgi:(2S)-methylsuccinyl-CoA dehydrogenase